jgi:serine/threonine-protein kinase HipA
MSDSARCKITLKPLTGKEKQPGYIDRSVISLLGSVSAKPALEFSRGDFFQQTVKLVEKMSISGVQQKLSLKLGDANKLVPTSTGGEYIIKPSPEQYPHAAENEHTAMVIHQHMGIDTALCGLVPFTDGELAYITKRFDKTDSGKLHQEDLLQCFGEQGVGKYDKTYEEAGKLLLEITNGKKAVILDYVKRVIMAYAIGNSDMHLKNLSVIRVGDNSTIYYDRLTPSYDNLFCDVYKEMKEGLSQLALGVLLDPEDGDEEFSPAHDHYGFYTGNDFVLLAERLQIPVKPVIKFIRKLESETKPIVDLINGSYMPAEMKKNAVELVEGRIGALAKTDFNDQ